MKSKPMALEPVITKDGSLTFRMVELNEHFHSLNGAMRESEHVYLNAGLKYFHDTFRQREGTLVIAPGTNMTPKSDCRSNEENFNQIYKASCAENAMNIRSMSNVFYDEKIKIFEAGFGTGLNAFLSLIYAIENNVKIEYTGIELYPLTKKLVNILNYPDFYSDTYKPLFRDLHFAPWNQMNQINEVFDLIKLEKDLTNYHFPENTYHLIYFDAFCPQKQPGLWSEEIFTGIYRSLIRGGILVTYSSKGDVRRNLESSGFRVEKLQGSPGKRHMLRASKNS